MAKKINNIDFIPVSSLDFSNTVICGNFDMSEKVKKYNEITREIYKNFQTGAYSKTFVKENLDGLPGYRA
jgi:hypothetical protein